MKVDKAFQAAVKIGLWSVLVLAVSSLAHLKRRQFQPSLSSLWGNNSQTKDPDLEHDLFSAYHDLFYDHGNRSASGGGKSNKSAIVGASVPILSVHGLYTSTLLKNSTVWLHTQTVTEPSFSPPSEDISFYLDARHHPPHSRRARRWSTDERYHQKPPPVQRSGSLPSFESPRYERKMPRMALRRRQSYSEEQGADQGYQYQNPYKIKVVKVVKTPPPKGLEQVNTQMAEFFSDNFWIPLLGAFFLAGTAVRIGLTSTTQTPIIANVTTNVINQAVILSSSSGSTVVSMVSEETITSSGGTSIVNTDTSSTGFSSVGITTIVTRIINTSSVVNRLTPVTNVMP